MKLNDTIGLMELSYMWLYHEILYKGKSYDSATSRENRLETIPNVAIEVPQDFLKSDDNISQLITRRIRANRGKAYIAR